MTVVSICSLATGGPLPIGSIESELSCPTSMIKLIYVCLAYFPAKTKLVSCDGMADDVRDMPSDVVAAFRRREADLLESTNLNVRRAENVLTFVGSIGAEEQAHRLRIETMVGVTEDLVEVVYSHQDLVRPARRKRRVHYRRIVEHVNGGGLKIVF